LDPAVLPCLPQLLYSDLHHLHVRGGLRPEHAALRETLRLLCQHTDYY
jgi:hypothetical protein